MCDTTSTIQTGICITSFLQQVIASRESLVDCIDEESDNANLMAKVS